jgi:thiol-disulfide isomerase/thioredoxin
LPSTPSSAEAGAGRGRVDARLVALLAVSLAIPAALLALILHSRDEPRAPAAGTTPTTDIAPYDATKARVGGLAPDFALPGLFGGTTQLSQYRGRPVVLTFFASWCHPCEEELPVLEQLGREYGDRIAVLGVNFRDDARDSRGFVRRLGVTFPTLGEDSTDGPVAARYGVRGPPMTFFIDAQGRVAAPPLYGEGSRGALRPGLDALLRRQ